MDSGWYDMSLCWLEFFGFGLMTGLWETANRCGHFEQGRRTLVPWRVDAYAAGESGGNKIFAVCSSCGICVDWAACHRTRVCGVAATIKSQDTSGYWSPGTRGKPIKVFVEVVLRCDVRPGAIP